VQNNKYFDKPADELLGECNPTMTQVSDSTLKKIIHLDYALVMDTIKQSKCPQEATQSALKAKEYFEYGNIEAGLTSLMTAWSKATYCS